MPLFENCIWKKYCTQILCRPFAKFFPTLVLVQELGSGLMLGLGLWFGLGLGLGTSWTGTSVDEYLAPKQAWEKNSPPVYSIAEGLKNRKFRMWTTDWSTIQTRWPNNTTFYRFVTFTIRVWFHRSNEINKTVSSARDQYWWNHHHNVQVVGATAKCCYMIFI